MTGATKDSKCGEPARGSEHTPGDERVIDVSAPWFEDFAVGQVFDAPGVTVTAGHAALHQALFGERLLMALDAPLCNAVTGEARVLASPALVANVAIGQTTFVSQRVKANLFYRGLRFARPVHIDDTLRTRTRVAGLRQNRVQAGRAATGVVALEIEVRNQDDQPVLHFWRAPMLPCRNPQAVTGHHDDLDALGVALTPEGLWAGIPADWALHQFRQRVPGPHFADVRQGTCYRIEARDTVTCAPELARLTLNMAMAHTDAQASYLGQRLVYGGHTIAMAFAQTLRALPNIVTLLAWQRCDHVAAVLEGDIVRTQVTVLGTLPHTSTGGGIVRLQAQSFAAHDRDPERQVLDWEFDMLMA